jgi:peptide/nickel transport system ATP-binding protein
MLRPANSSLVQLAIPDEVILRVAGLTKHFKTGKAAGEILRAVDDVSFDVPVGRTLAIVGESGCGKTTTARCILKALQPTSGSIWFRTASGTVVDLATLDAEQIRPLRTELQMVFQDPYSSLNPRMNVRDIVGEPLVIHGVKDRAEIEQRVGELLELVGLRRDHMTRYPNAFSGGQRQRIGIARALALRPKPFQRWMCRCRHRSSTCCSTCRMLFT